MAMKSKSVQLPEQVWKCLESYANENQITSVSATVRIATTELLRKELLNSLATFRILLNTKPHAIDGVTSDRGIFNEILVFMDIKDVPIIGTTPEIKKQLTKLFTKDKEILNELLNYLEKRALRLDDEAIVDWWTDIPLDVPRIEGAGNGVAWHNGRPTG